MLMLFNIALAGTAVYLAVEYRRVMKEEEKKLAAYKEKCEESYIIMLKKYGL